MSDPATRAEHIRRWHGLEALIAEHDRFFWVKHCLVQWAAFLALVVVVLGALWLAGV